MTAKQILAEIRLRTNTKRSDIELYRAIGDACDDVRNAGLALADPTRPWHEAVIDAAIRRLPQ